MNFLKDYKGMLLIILIITILNIIWVINGPQTVENKQVKNDTIIVLNN